MGEEIQPHYVQGKEGMKGICHVQRQEEALTLYCFPCLAEANPSHTGAGSGPGETCTILACQGAQMRLM